MDRQTVTKTYNKVQTNTKQTYFHARQQENLCPQALIRIHTSAPHFLSTVVVLALRLRFFCAGFLPPCDGVMTCLEPSVDATSFGCTGLAVRKNLEKCQARFSSEAWPKACGVSKNLWNSGHSWNSPKPNIARSSSRYWPFTTSCSAFTKSDRGCAFHATCCFKTWFMLSQLLFVHDRAGNCRPGLWLVFRFSRNTGTIQSTKCLTNPGVTSIQWITVLVHSFDLRCQRFCFDMLHHVWFESFVGFLCSSVGKFALEFMNSNWRKFASRWFKPADSFFILCWVWMLAVIPLHHDDSIRCRLRFQGKKHSFLVSLAFKAIQFVFDDVWLRGKRV